jgi:superfamily I DNA and/or RNA helicase
MLRELAARGVPAASVGVICLYAAQSHLIAQMLRSAGLAGGDAVAVNTIDAFQGQERNIIIVSTSRTTILAAQPQGQGQAGASAGAGAGAASHVCEPRRLCVLLTRARHHLIVACHAAALLSHSERFEAAGGVGVWSALLRLAAAQVGGLRSAALPQLLEPVGGGAR